MTGNSPGIQSNHILLNQAGNGQSSLVVAGNTQVVPSERHSVPSSQSQDVITFVNPEQPSTAPLQMVYSPGSGVIYASASGGFKRSGNQQRTSDGVSLQHTPVIQTSSLQPEHSTVRHIVDDGTIIVRQSELKK